MTAGYIFDYGGTLDQAERTLGSQHIILPTDTFRTTLETKIRLQLDYLGRLSPLTSYLSPLLEDLYDRTKAETSRSREVLRQLKAQTPLVLVSNFYGNISVVLREFGLDQMFQSVIESAVVGVRKPDPRIFLMGAEALQLDPSQVTVVGDSLSKDILPARRAGCQTVWLKGEGWTKDEETMASEADRIIRSLDELLVNKEIKTI